MSSEPEDAGPGGGAGQAHSHGGARHTHAHGHSAHAHDFSVPELPEAVDIFDTILRDGSQQEGLSLTVDDKLRVAEQLDHLGVTFIEGGWPGANPKDIEFFARAKKELKLGTATLVAFGSTRRAGVLPEHDAVLANLIEAGAPVACIVAKSWDRHVAEALRTSLDEAVAMVADSVRYLRAHDLRVFLDAEHFFDGYRGNPEFALSVLAAAEEAGAEALVLCDTNGGSLPDDVGQAVADVRARTDAQLGIHCHNDAGCAVANSLVAVQAGVTQVQGCINGYGERAGNTDLSAAIPEPVPQAPHPHHSRRPPRAPDAGGAPHRRAGEHRTQPAAALRGPFGLRPQGRPSRQRGGAQRRPLRARRAERGRQRHPRRRLRDGRPLDPGHEGGRARARPRRRGDRPRAR